MMSPRTMNEQLRGCATVPISLLIAHDDETTCRLCATVAIQADLRVTIVHSAEEARDVLESGTVDILVTRSEFAVCGPHDLLKYTRERAAGTAVIVIGSKEQIDSSTVASGKGMLDYIAKPPQASELRIRLDCAIQSVRIRQENRMLRARLALGKLVGLSEKMLTIYGMIEKIAPKDHSVLIMGETGTGKELVARAIHASSPRRNGPFVPVDCAAITPTLVESELFGYVRGAFTGATASKQGLLEIANRGTLFLDEIGDMPMDQQAKLLRVIQEREIKAVGAIERRKIDVRIIAATNRDLETAIRNGTFRQDLYFRLNVFPIHVPPLRERKTDIPLLAASFLEKYADLNEPTRVLSDDALQRLIAYDWPGNVRELENAMERSLTSASGPVVQAVHLPSNLHFPPASTRLNDNEILPLDELERRAILAAIRATSNNVWEASKILGIGKTTMYRKLRQYNEVVEEL
jgi:DNA-binding NtrC family response regulator